MSGYHSNVRRFVRTCALVAVLAMPSSGFARIPLHFSAPRNFVTCPIPSQVLPMDLDADGDRDVAVVCGGILDGYRLQLFENPGDGSLLLHSAIPLSTDNRLIASDLNGDGRLDLAQARTVATVNGELITLTQGGPFSFSQRTQTLPFPASELCAGDFDGLDGPDLVIGDDLSGPRAYLYLADGAGAFVGQGSFETEDQFRDVNGDGQPDVQTPVDVLHCLAADLDGDNDDDLVVTNSMTRRLVPSDTSITTTDVVALINIGTGQLGPFQILLNADGETLGIGDMDGDGDEDIVTTGTSLTGPDRDDVILLRNRGDGTFHAGERYPSGGGLDSVGGLALGDVDLDGDLDVGTMLFGPLRGNVNDNPADRWALLRNNTAGQLGAPEIYPAGADILALAIADLDGLSGPEALTTAGDDDRVTVSYNWGGGYLVPTAIDITDPRAPISGTTPTGIDSGDFNNDGWPDLAVIADHDRLTDGGPDIVTLILGQAGGLLAAPLVIDLAEEGPTALYADSMAGDAATDIGIAFLSSSLFGDPEGVGLSLGSDGGLPQTMRFTALNGAPVDLTALDVNGDGTLDLAALRYRDAGITCGIGVMAASSEGTLAFLGDLLLGSDDVLQFDARLPEVIASADMNGDARKDLVAVSSELSNRIVTVILNNGDLSFLLAGESAAGSAPVTDVIGSDVTGNGLSDVVLTTTGTLAGGGDGSLVVFPNLGGGVLGPPVSHKVGTGPAGVVAADVDGVHGMDLVVASDGSNEVTVLFNDGSGGFSRQERYLAGGGGDGLTMADVNQDGALDVAVVNDNHLIDRHFATVTLLNGGLDLRVSLDLDRNGIVEPQFDGLLVLRRLFGFSGDALTAGALSPTAQETDPALIAGYIDNLGAALDIDGNGRIDALTDGLLILRRLSGFSGPALTAGALAPDATRTDPDAIAMSVDALQ